MRFHTRRDENGGPPSGKLPFRVAVIIPCLNEAEQITECVQSARTAGADEILVVDGGSRDATPILARNAGAVVVTSEPGRGPQQNLGAAQSTCDVFVFLHADCRLPADAIRQIQTCLQATSAIVGGSFWQHIPKSGWTFRWLEYGNALRARLLQLPYGDQAIFVRRHVFTSVEGFPNEPLMEDVVLATRLKRRGKLTLLQGPITVSPRRWERTGVFRQTLRNWLLLSAFLLGVSPRHLVRHYPRHDAEPT